MSVPWINTLWRAAKNWNADNAFKHSAAVSFYTLFSIAPVTIIAVTIGAVFLGQEAATQQFKSQVGQLVGPASAELVQAAATATRAQGRSWFSAAVGIALLLVGATSVFAQLQDSLNDIFGVRARPGRRAWSALILRRVISFAMVLTVGFLLLVSLVITTMLTSALGFLQEGILASPVLMKTADITVGLAVISLLFALLFKVLPDVKLRWQDAGLGAFLTAALFTLGRYGIALYLGHSTIASIYGTAGSLVALLIWVYYSCAILFYGAEFIRAYRSAQHLNVEPKENAVAVREEVVPRPAPKSRG